MIEFIKIDEFTPDNTLDYIRFINKELNEKIESGEYVYLRDILERLGFDEFQIGRYIFENGDVRWGPNGMERKKITATIEWVKEES